MCVCIWVCVISQDRRVISMISNYFKKNLEEIEFDDEDKFIEALQKL